MLDYFSIFTLGGAVLWCHEWTALKGNPINALIQTCIIEQRASHKQFSYTAPQSVSYTLKWTQNNELGLVFVAVYRSVLSLPYVDDLLKRVKNVFEYSYDAKQLEYPDFTTKFQEVLARCEAEQEPDRSNQSQLDAVLRDQKQSGNVEEGEDDEDDEDEDEDNQDGDVHKVDEALGSLDISNAVAQDSELDKKKAGNSAFDTSKLKSLRRRKGGKQVKEQTDTTSAKAKRGRKWGLSAEEQQQLDFTDKSEAQFIVHEKVKGKSMMDEEQDVKLDGDALEKSGWLSSVLKKVNKNINVTGQSTLEEEDVKPILEILKEKFIAKNVAEEVAQKVIDSVETNMVGTKLSSFTRVSTVVNKAVEEALTNILSPGRNINVLQEIESSKREGEPYSIVFIGVNGVGKSTNLAKVAFWLMQHGMQVMIAACDTFRSGAVEQLRTHTSRLGVELFERGYEKDPAAVAREGLKKAKELRKDVLLIDTAGRMQDNEPLMRALAKLINMNKPNLTLFVGEALVGNEAVDQLMKFNSRLKELSTDDPPHQIDGIVLTKFDTIDTKVGAALSMVYISGAPVIFVGCGQTYTDLRRLNVKQIVSNLLE